MSASLLETLIRNKAPVTLFLLNGVKLTGNLTGIDNHPLMSGLLLTRDNVTLFIRADAVSTIAPGNAV